MWVMDWRPRQACTWHHPGGSTGSSAPAGAGWPGDIVHDVVVGDVGLVLVLRDGGLLLAGVPQVSRFDHGEVARCQEWQLS